MNEPLEGAAPRPRRRRVLGAVLVTAAALLIALAVGVVWSCAGRSGPELETGEVARRDVRVTVTATGTVQAVTTVEVGSEVTGRVLAVLASPNDVVTKGQLLAQIDPELLRAALDEASAQVASAEAAIRTARATQIEADATLGRVRLQAADGLVSRKDLEAAIAAAARARAGVESAAASATLARAGLKSARSKLEKSTIVSPIDGIVLSRLVEPGQTVTAGFTTPVLFRLAQDLTRMRLDVDVDEADVGRVGEGQEATFTVEAYPDRDFPSRVISLRNEPKTSQSVVTYQAILAVDNGERLLRPGMTCTATILADLRSDALVVPSAALRFTPPAKGGLGPEEKRSGVESDRRDKQRVWILDGKIPKAIPVRAGATDGAFTEILDGDLTPGERVLVDVKDEGG